MISVIVYGRNDSHGYNLPKRAALSFNCIAEVLTHPDDEIVFVDCNTPDDLPTFPESIADTLTPRAKALMRVLRLRPAAYEKGRRGAKFKVLEPLCRNVGIRRTNPANRWVLNTNTDMVFTPLLSGNSLSDVIADLADGFYELPRFEVPEILWETMDRQKPREILEAFARWGHRLHLNEVVHNAPEILFDGPGDFQLALRAQLFAIHGMDERMTLGWHVDSNLCKRMFLLNGETKSLLDRCHAYHCDHTRLNTPYHSAAGSTSNDWRVFFRDVLRPELPGQAATWGLPDEPVEEFRLTEQRGARYVRILEALLPGTRGAMTCSAIKSESFNHGLLYETRHILPYVTDHLTMIAPADDFAYAGGNLELVRLVAAFRKGYGHTGRVLFDGEIMARAGHQGQALPEGCVPLSFDSLLGRGRVFCFDFWMGQFPRQKNRHGFEVTTPSEAAGGFAALLLRRMHEFACAEKAGCGMAGRPPRKSLFLGTQNTWVEHAVTQLFGVVMTPYSSYTRHGFVRGDALEQPLEPVPGHHLFLADSPRARVDHLTKRLGRNVVELELLKAELFFAELAEGGAAAAQPRSWSGRADFELKRAVLEMSILLAELQMKFDLADRLQTVLAGWEWQDEAASAAGENGEARPAPHRRTMKRMPQSGAARVGVDARLLAGEGTASPEARDYVTNHLTAIITARPAWQFVLLHDAGAGGDPPPSFLNHPNVKAALIAESAAQDFDLLFVPDALHALDREWLPRLWPEVPVVVLLHELCGLRHYYRGWTSPEKGRYLERLDDISQRADRVLTTTRFLKRDFSRCTGLAGNRIEEVLGSWTCPPDNQPIPPARRDAVLARYSIRKPFFLHVGAGDPHKNLRAAFLSCARLPEGAAQLVLAGRKTGALEQLADKAAASGTRNVIFPGELPREDMEVLYREAAALLLPSIYEGFSLPLVDAMARGCPVVSSNAPGTVEVAGEASARFYPDDIPALAKGLARLLEDAALREGWAARGRARAAQLTWAEASRRTLRVMESVLKGEEPAGETIPGAGQTDCRHQSAGGDAAAPGGSARPPRWDGRLVWIAPWQNSSGYATEALSFAHGVDKYLKLELVEAAKHKSSDYVAGLPPEQRHWLRSKLRGRVQLAGKVVIQHLPGSALSHHPHAAYHIARTMFETDRLPSDWVDRCNLMDEIWVPSHFNLETFAAAGVARDKLVLMPGTVDERIFDPRRHEPLALPRRAGFNFLFVAQWYVRKGWDALLASYLSEFSASDDVCLYLRVFLPTLARGTTRDVVRAALRETAATLQLGHKPLPRVEILADEIAPVDLPRLYKAVDCLVAPSRGEGWGRPLHEAMLMELPVIGTNWSANTEFMNPANSYLLDYELVEAAPPEREQSHVQGHRWAEPSRTHLRQLLRRVFEQREEGRERGRIARANLVKSFGYRGVSEWIRKRLGVVERILSERAAGAVPAAAVVPDTPPERGVKHGVREGAGHGFPAVTPGDQAGAQDADTASTTLAWEGSFLDHGSLSHVNRQLTAALERQPGMSIARLDASPQRTDPAGVRRFSGLAVKLQTGAPADTRVTVRHAWPPNWKRPARGAWVLMQPWEFGSLPRDWVKRMEAVDEVWAYTEYVRQVYVASGVPEAKVRLVPCGIDPELFRPGLAPLPLATRKTFKFLFVGGTIHRKGPDVLLKAFLRAFTADDDVCLVIKDFGGQSVYGGQTMGARIKELAARPGCPEIVHLEEELAGNQMPALYAACDCLVHPYRGEGFGLPVLEAMACGLPVIVTQGGATDDFARPEHVFHLPAERKSIGREVATLALAGEGWLLEPSLPALVERMKWVVQHPDQARERGRTASDYVRREWTWDKAAALAGHRLSDLKRKAPQPNRMTDAPPVPVRVKPTAVPEVARVGNLDEAQLHFGRKEHVRAWESTIRAIQTRPFHPEGFLLLALIARAAGDLVRARQCAERARRMAPGWKSAQKFLKSLPRQAPASRVSLPPWPKALDEDNSPRLTVCLIARNEEQFIGQALRSVAGVAAQIVVVDTGSTDSTVDIARAAGAEVYHCPWTDDFSAPRNEALRHAAGDWVLSLDADEELSKEDAAEVLKAMKDARVLAYRLPIFDAGSEANGCHYVPRLFRNTPGAHFTGRVHEQAFSSLEPLRREWGLANQLGAVRLVHHGYTREMTQSRDKIARNLRLLDLALAETPGDVNLLMNRGLELMRNDQPEAGLASYREAVETLAARKPGEVSPELREVLLTQYSTHLLRAQKLEEVCVLLQSPLARASGLSASLHFNLGMALARRGQFQEAAGQMRQCLAKRTQPSLAPANPEVRRGGPYHCLALCLGRLEQTEAEERAYADGLKADPKSRPLRLDFARFLARVGRKQEALHVLYQLVAERPLDIEAWQMGGQLALSDPAFAEFAADWTAEAAGRLPGDPVIAAQRAEVLKRARFAEAVVA